MSLEDFKNLLTSKKADLEKKAKPKLPIGVQELQDRWEDKFNPVARHVAMELCPAFIPSCKKSWTFYGASKRKREQQLIMLEMHETHYCDFYENRQPITPL